MSTFPEPTLAECREAVSRPGKFEGEPAWVFWFHHWMMEGDGEPAYATEDAEEPEAWEFPVEDADRGMFPELADRKVRRVRITETTDGFVHGAYRCAGDTTWTRPAPTRAS